MAGADTLNWQQIGDVPLTVPGGVIPLREVAQFSADRGPGSIERLAQQRVINIGAGTANRPLNELVAELRNSLATVVVPPGFTVHSAGEDESKKESFADLLMGVFIALFLVFAVLAVQFESLREPLLVLAVVPIAVTGTGLTLLLTGTTLNMNSFLGIIVLVGIVVNNSIVYVDYANLLVRGRNVSVQEAVLLAGRRRLRPILMTTITTVLGMAPLAIGLGEGSELQVPLGRAIVGGLTAGTLGSLLALPALYLSASRFHKK